MQAVFHNNFRFLRLERYINGNKPEYAAENINHERDPVNDSPNLTFGFDKIPCGERDCNQKRKLCDKIENTRYVTQTARVQDRADYKQEIKIPTKAHNLIKSCFAAVSLRCLLRFAILSYLPFFFIYYITAILFLQQTLRNFLKNYFTIPSATH